MRFHVLWNKSASLRFDYPDSSLLYADSAAQFAEEIAVLKWQGVAADLQGSALLIAGQYEQALPYFIRSLEVATTQNNKRSVAFVTTNIATIQLHQGNGIAAQRGFTKSYHLFTELGETIWAGGAAEGIGKSFAVQGHFDSAIHYLQYSISVMQKNGFDDHAFDARMGLAEIKHKQGLTDEAKALFREELTGNTEIEETILQCAILLQQAKSNVYLEYLTEAERLYNRTIAIAQERTFSEELVQAYEGLGQLHERQGNFEGALQNMHAANEVREELSMKRTNERIAAINSRFEAAQAEAELERKAAIIASQKTKMVLVAALAVLGLLGTLFMLFLYRNKRKVNTQLQAKNALVSDMLEEKQLLLRELHHRVKNNMQTVSSLLRMQSRSLTDPESRDAMDEAMRRVKSMALVHQDLYHGSKLSQVQLDNYLSKLTTGLINSYSKEDSVSFVGSMQPIALHVDTAIPLGLIVNELVTNALQHAFPEGRQGEIKLVLKDHGNAIELVVADNGIGQISKSKPEEQLGTIGVGVEIVRTFARTLNADWEVNSLSGTEVKLLVRNFIRA